MYNTVYVYIRLMNVVKYLFANEVCLWQICILKITMCKEKIWILL